ncbi:hypothetical protein HA62_11310 [Pseudomonas putida]|nr:hypothetical protein HA62_11310 [Pseudomonas putida]
MLLVSQIYPRRVHGTWCIANQGRINELRKTFCAKATFALVQYAIVSELYEDVFSAFRNRYFRATCSSIFLPLQTGPHYARLGASIVSSVLGGFLWPYAAIWSPIFKSASNPFAAFLLERVTA